MAGWPYCVDGCLLRQTGCMLIAHAFELLMIALMLGVAKQPYCLVLWVSRVAIAYPSLAIWGFVQLGERYTRLKRSYNLGKMADSDLKFVMKRNDEGRGCIAATIVAKSPHHAPRMGGLVAKSVCAAQNMYSKCSVVAIIICSQSE